MTDSTDHASPDSPHHPAVAAILRHFAYGHLRTELQDISRPCSELAHEMAGKLEGPELTTGLRKLLEAKDCLVRARLEQLYPDGLDGRTP